MLHETPKQSLWRESAKPNEYHDPIAWLITVLAVFLEKSSGQEEKGPNESYRTSGAGVRPGIELEDFRSPPVSKGGLLSSERRIGPDAGVLLAPSQGDFRVLILYRQLFSGNLWLKNVGIFWLKNVGSASSTAS